MLRVYSVTYAVLNNGDTVMDRTDMSRFLPDSDKEEMNTVQRITSMNGLQNL